MLERLLDQLIMELGTAFARTVFVPGSALHKLSWKLLQIEWEVGYEYMAVIIRRPAECVNTRF